MTNKMKTSQLPKFILILNLLLLVIKLSKS